jgi:hypothetical protein
MNDRFGETVPFVGTEAMGAIRPFGGSSGTSADHLERPFSHMPDENSRPR